MYSIKVLYYCIIIRYSTKIAKVGPLRSENGKIHFYSGISLTIVNFGFRIKHC